MDNKVTLVAGLGNPILGDDGAGWRVADELLKALAHFPHLLGEVEVVHLSLGGLSLMEHLIGYQRAILVDAVNLQQGRPGTLHCFPLESLPDQAAGHTSSVHDTSLLTALQLGRSMGASLPDQINVVGIEADIGLDFSEDLTPAVAEAIPQAVQIILDMLRAASDV